MSAANGRLFFIVYITQFYVAIQLAGWRNDSKKRRDKEGILLCRAVILIGVAVASPNENVEDVSSVPW